MMVAGLKIRHSASAALAALVASACSHAPPSQPPPVPPAASVVAPHATTGTYDLTTTLPSRRPTQTSRPRGGTRPAPGTTPTLELVYRPLAAPDATAPSSTQLSATINLPGYTRAPRGRTGQAAAWWPLPGDSVIVHFQPPQGKGTIDLRGALQGDTLSGDVWYTSLGTGAAFQMGTFRAIKRKK
jgi:hypothetical protein